MKFGSPDKRRTQFGYNAIVDKGRRQAPKTVVQSEDKVLKSADRNKLLATVQDQNRNHALIAWMTRKHLDYVSKFHFSFRTATAEADESRVALDLLVNQIFQWHGAPTKLDTLARFGRDEMFRLFELEKVTAGDAAINKLAGLKLQAIESDLICKGSDTPTEIAKTINDSGWVVDNEGRVLQASICQRVPNANKPKFNHLEPIENLIYDAYWTRFSSQSRGVSPLSTAINTVQDISEGFEFNLIKAKMHALMGVAITRNPEGEPGFGAASGQSDVRDWVAEAWTWTVGQYCAYGGILYKCLVTNTTTAASVFSTDLTAGKWVQDTTDTALTINPKDINIFDLNPGEDAKLLSSNSPSNEFVNGSYLFVQIAMLALDFPATFFDSRRSSFSARIADLNEYEVSADSKRTKNRYVRKQYSDWLIESIWDTPGEPWGLRQAAERAGLNMMQVQAFAEWIPAGSPWMDKLKQVMGDQLAINMGLDNSIDAARRRGSDIFKNIDKQAQVQAYAKQKGVDISSIPTSGRSVEEVAAAVTDEVMKSTISDNGESNEGNDNDDS